MMHDLKVEMFLNTYKDELVSLYTFHRDEWNIMKQELAEERIVTPTADLVEVKLDAMKLVEFESQILNSNLDPLIILLKREKDTLSKNFDILGEV